MATYIVNDLHGNYDLIQQTVDAIMNMAKGDMLIINGDGAGARGPRMNRIVKIFYEVRRGETDISELLSALSGIIGEIPDIPKKVIKMKKINGERYCKIKWRKRRNNNNPTPSYVKYDEIKEKFPLILLDYIEKHIHMEDSPEIKLDVNDEQIEKGKNGKNKK